MSELEQDLRTIFNLLKKHSLAINPASQDSAWLEIYQGTGVGRFHKEWIYTANTPLRVCSLTDTELEVIVKDIVNSLEN